MDPQTILDLYDQEMRKDPAAGQATVYQRPGLTYITVPPPSPRFGWVLYTRLDPDAADQAIDSTIDFFKQYQGEFEWKVYWHDTPSDLKERLLARGFVPEELESVVALDLETVPQTFWEPSSANVRRITDPRGLADITRIETEVWDEPFSGLEEMLGAEMQATPDQISIYVADAGGEPASSAWIRYYPGRQFAELYGGATVPGQRGKGLYTALVKARAREARQRGVRFLVVDTSPMSRPVLEKLGFVFLTYSQPFVMKVSGPKKIIPSSANG
jgi:GNAT superfamily N-acetyltransferase